MRDAALKTRGHFAGQNYGNVFAMGLQIINFPNNVENYATTSLSAGCPESSLSKKSQSLHVQAHL
jgi:hypothetical protein